MNTTLAAARSVLIIEDDLACLGAIRRILEHYGFDARAAPTSAEGLAQVRDSQPDLILLDIHLPRINGIELYKILKKVPQTRSIPIILMTGEEILDGILEAAAGGLRAEAIYRKGSFDFEDLVGRIRRALSNAPRSPEKPFEPSSSENILRQGPVSLDLLRREVLLAGGRSLRLAPRPFEILVALLRRDGPVSAQELQRQVWPGNPDLKKVGVTVMRLRRSLRKMRGLRVETVDDAYRLVITSAKNSKRIFPTTTT